MLLYSGGSEKNMNKDDCEKHLTREKSMLPAESEADISDVKKKKGKRSFNGYYLIAAFFIPFVIMLGVYACLGKHPFGNNSVLTLDLQAQYVYYYEAIRRLLTEGGSWLYSWERTLGWRDGADVCLLSA